MTEPLGHHPPRYRAPGPVTRLVCQRTHITSGIRADEIDRARHEELVAALSRLTPRCRAAFVLTNIVGLSYAEAAAICHCRISTIRRRVAHARTDLIRALYSC